MTNQNQLIEDLTLVPIPQWYENPYLWAAVLIFGALAVYLIRRHLRNRSISLKPFTPAHPTPPPHLEALKRLEALRTRHAQLTAYQVALECSDILRRYIELRFTSPIRYQTTREFLGAIHGSPELTGESRDELGAFLKFFDEIKFAQQTADTARTATAIDGAERFIKRCIPTEIAPSVQTENSAAR